MEPNGRLRGALIDAGLTTAELAARTGVDTKTAQRWTRGRVPHRRNRLEVARALRADDQFLWPETATEPAALNAVQAELVRTYAGRAHVPTDLWLSLLDSAEAQIDILAFAASFLHDAIPNLRDHLAEAHGRGVSIRILLGDPESDAVAIRGAEEGIKDSLAHRCIMSWRSFLPVTSLPAVEARRHSTTLYASIFRFDEHILANHHLYGAPASESPVFHFRSLPGGRMAQLYRDSFDRTWEGAS
ncbi:XRE family transcriptional regulator [Naumannella halotolerans]|uniref:XRE family transcriptional regulator n=1 Tax=Naumannella halotolerans TaxID=993414 RepID=UPI00370D6CE4